MKKMLFPICIALLFSTCSNHKQEKGVEAMVCSEFDTVRVNKLIDSSRTISVSRANNNGVESFLGIHKNAISIGRLRDGRGDGRLYMMDLDNRLIGFSYRVHGQTIYRHRLEDDAVYGNDVDQIDSSNIRFILPPKFVSKEIDDSTIEVKIIGENYPLVLSSISCITESCRAIGMPKRNYMEESVKYSWHIGKKPYQFSLGFCDKYRNSIKKYEWTSEDKVLKEVSLEQH